MKICYFGISLLVSMLLCWGCANLNDSHTDLGDGYTYITDSKFRKIIPNNVYINTAVYSTVVNYNVDYHYIIAKQIPDYQNYKISIGLDLETRYMIYCSYLKDSVSKDFEGLKNIIKYDSSLYKNLISKHITDGDTRQDQQKIDDVVDSIFHHDPYYVRLLTSKENYWIIEKKQNIRIGPLSKKEFNHRCDSLKIRMTLKE